MKTYRIRIKGIGDYRCNAKKSSEAVKDCVEKMNIGIQEIQTVKSTSWNFTKN